MAPSALAAMVIGLPGGAYFDAFSNHGGEGLAEWPPG
jgi:hypothetical protein